MEDQEERAAGVAAPLKITMEKTGSHFDCLTLQQVRVSLLCTEKKKRAAKQDSEHGLKHAMVPCVPATESSYCIKPLVLQPVFIKSIISGHWVHTLQ